MTHFISLFRNRRRLAVLPAFTLMLIAAAPATSASPRSVKASLASPGDSVADARRAFDAGKTAFDRADYDEAAKEFEIATALRPNDANNFLWLGNALIHQTFAANMIRKAILGPRARNAWERAAALDPRNIPAREYLVVYYGMAPRFLGGGMDKAEAMATEVRGISPYRGLLLLGGVAERRKNFDGALAFYDQAALLPADSGTAFESRLVLLDGQQRFPEAFASIDARLKAAPSDFFSLYHLGRAAALSGQRIEEGLLALRRVTTTEPPAASGSTAGDVRYWLGILLEKKGDRAGAATELRMAVALNPADEEAKAALARVQQVP